MLLSETSCLLSAPKRWERGVIPEFQAGCLERVSNVLSWVRNCIARSQWKWLHSANDLDVSQLIQTSPFISCNIATSIQILTSWSLSAFSTPTLTVSAWHIHFPGFKPQNHKIHIKINFYIIRLLITLRNTPSTTACSSFLLFYLAFFHPASVSLPHHPTPLPPPDTHIYIRHRTGTLVISPPFKFTSPHLQRWAV